jgi:hypothetical protein
MPQRQGEEEEGGKQGEEGARQTLTTRQETCRCVTIASLPCCCVWPQVLGVAACVVG